MKKKTILLLTFVPSFTLLAALLLTARPGQAQAEAAILYVAPGGACGGGALPCYASIQAAVDDAATGDEIRVATGVYTDLHLGPRQDVTTTGVVTQTVYLTKTVTIRGGYNLDFSTWDPQTYSTTLDVQHQGRGLYITGDIQPTIEGLRVINGNALGLGGYSYYGEYDAGGGIFVMTATATLLGNIIGDNQAEYGGGVFLNNSSSLLEGNHISKNFVITGGGGIAVYKQSPRFTNNIFQLNLSANLGGGLYLFSTNATLEYNQILDNSTQNYGGGVDVASCNPTFNGNLISGNHAIQKGGGLFLWYSASRLTNNAILGNSASASGSGLYIGGSNPVLLHTTFVENTGGDGSAVFINSDGGSSSSNVTITNTLSVSQSVGISITGNSTALIDGILWFGTPITVSQGAATVIVQHQHSGDPAFAADGYHLTAGSAAIDQGMPAGVLTDIDRQPRPFDMPDLGADEYWLPGSTWSVYLPCVIR